MSTPSSLVHVNLDPAVRVEVDGVPGEDVALPLARQVQALPVHGGVRWMPRFAMVKWHTTRTLLVMKVVRLGMLLAALLKSHAGNFRYSAKRKGGAKLH